MGLNIAEYVLSRHIKMHKNRVAILLVDDVGVHRNITYNMLYQNVCCMMVGLQSFALPKGTVVCIQAADVYDLLVLFLASNAAGLVPSPLLLSLSVAETEYILQDSNAALFFCLTKQTKPIQIPSSCKVVQFAEYKELSHSPFQTMQTQTDADDAAFLFYTSGSSGSPKGVLHAQHAILGRKPSIEHWLPLEINDIVMQTDNLCWTYSMFTGFLDPLSVGATALIVTLSNQAAMAEDKISPDKWLDIIMHYRVNVIVSTPNIFSSIVTSPRLKTFQNHCLRQAGAAGAFLADEVQQLWISHFDFPIFIALGMSEISTFISMGPQVAYRKDRLGKIQPGRKIAILPIEGGIEPVEVNTQGMLAIHRDELGLMMGYVGSHRSDKSKYRGDWFLTQDLVSMDTDGYIQFHGRADMLLKVDGGFRISPIEVEKILKLHPVVLDAACDAFFDSKTSSNQLIAYIVAEHIDQKTSADIYQFLMKHLSDYKIPHHLWYVESLPLTNRHKINRKNLQKLIPLQKYQY